MSINIDVSFILSKLKHILLAQIALLFGFTLLITAILPSIKAHATNYIDISDCAGLQGIGSDVDHPLNGDYRLIQDINCSDSHTWDSGKGFDPIGDFSNRFSGTLDGQNHTVSNLFINRTNWFDNNIGLFSIIDEGATVTNLNLTNVDINGGDLVGALAGGLVGHVENITATGQVHGIDTVGGLVGQHVPVDNLNNSSPLVFTWNGQKYNYVADVGSQLPKDTSGTDFAQIDNTNLVPKDGKYSMKIAQEYNEIVYYDELALKTFDHVPGYTVVEPFNRTAGEGDLRTVSENPTNLLQACTDTYGHDCTNDLKAYDDNWGYKDLSNDNCWTMDFGDLSAAKDTNVQLLMRGARDYSQTPTTKMRSVSVKDGSGNWVSVYDKKNMGSDATPRLRSLDLTHKFLSNDYHVKVCLDTWQMNYFAVDTTPQVAFTEHTYHPDVANLGYHGFTAIDDSHYPNHDYNQVSDHPQEMLQTQYGNFTKYGDVKPLLNTRDDHFVVMHYGDQLDVQFPYEAPSSGTERSFILYNDVFYKHANLGDIGRVADSPMPYHGMGTFAANTQYPQTPENLAYLSEWNTRHFDGTGRTGGSTIVNSTTNVSVSSDNCNIGGMVGYNTKPITGSSAYGDVSGNCNVGGLVGYDATTASTLGDITDSSASGSVEANNTAGGLIGTVNGEVTISGSYADGTEVSSSSGNVGGLVGSSANGTYSNSYAQVGAVHGGAYAGGLIGSSYGNNIDSSYSSSIVDGSSYLGGFVGFSNLDTITQSYASGDVIGTDHNIGGFVGNLPGGSITDSYATGNSSADGGYVGGFAGSIYGGDVERDYASGSATIGTGNIQAGGFAGQAYHTGSDITIKDSFASGAVTATGGYGGFIGSLDTNNMTFSNNYFDITATHVANCMAANTTVNGCTGVNSDGSNSSIFKSASDQPVTGWDRANVWQVPSSVNNGYPCLRWQADCNLSDTAVLSSAEDNTPILLDVVGCDTIASSGTSKEAGLAVQDSGYSYPVGLINFHLNTCNNGGNAVIRAIFTSNLDPTQVTIRKYNSVTHTFTTLTNENSSLTVTKVTLDNKAALAVQYIITDNGPFDQNATLGEITDPVGIAVQVIATPNTGFGGLKATN